MVQKSHSQPPFWMVLKPCKSLDKLPTSTGAGEKKAWLLLDAWLEGVGSCHGWSCFHSAQVVATEPPREQLGGFPPLLRGGAPVAGCLHFANLLVKRSVFAIFVGLEACIQFVF